MNLLEIHRTPARQIAQLVRNGEIDPEEVVEHFLERIQSLDDEINSFVHLNKDGALERAGRLRAKLKVGGEAGVLCGVPVAVKDNIVTCGMPTTCCSKMLSGYIPPYNATVIERLLAADAIIIGKTNMDEFAMGSSNETSFFGPVKNPGALDRVPGGSSGGSCAAVAAGFAPLALGSDTGGSIRQPAALCGVVGLKPTYGMVSRYGLIAFASSLDQIGPIAMDVEDASLLLSVIGGHDPLDSTSLCRDVSDIHEEIGQDVEGMRIGVPTEYFPPELEGSVRNACETALKLLEHEGAEIVKISLPLTEFALAAYHIVANAEASSNLARYDGVRFGFRGATALDLWEMYARTRSEGFGREVKRRVMLGTFVLSEGYYGEYYLKGMRARNLIKREFKDAFDKIDVILAPTTPDPAFKLGERLESPVSMYMSDVFVTPANLAGIPAVSIPAGSDRGLPVGIQLLGSHCGEKTILTVAKMLEGRLN
ncbi:MAG: Asp-tRNA(Asn)/Glu-tRNA(Gln) amidotransferase subunit GatA [Candidatus Glassbacteria bacterium]